MRTDLELLRDLELGGAITPTSLQLPDGTSYPKVEALFAYFGKVSHALRWYLGDLICWGEGRYGERIYQASEASGLTPGTLQNYASVCGRVAPDRRREGLSFALHSEVASLEPAEQEAWLARAEDAHWTVKQLRELLHDGGLVVKRESPQWTPLSEREPQPSTDVSTSPVRQGAVGTASEPSLSESGGTTGAGPPLVPWHATVLAMMRDELPDDKEVQRDALNWALELLAPELA